MDKSFFRQANANYVGHLVNTAQTHTVFAAEDIYDDRQRKLWARGRPLTLSVRERLLVAKLKKPLELSVQVENGIAAGDVVREVERLLAASPDMRRLAGTHAAALIAFCRALKIAGMPQTALTALAGSGTGQLAHAVTTAVVAAAIALRLELADATVVAALHAGLLHDAGELYLETDDRRAERDLNLESWKRQAVHPRIGGLLLGEFSDLPATVRLAVEEHHERLDGSGYPGGRSGDALSRLGQILMVADFVAASHGEGQDEAARTLLGLRLVPTQFPSELVAILWESMNPRFTATPAALDVPFLSHTAAELRVRLHRADREARRIGSDSELPEPERRLGAHVEELCGTLTRSLHETGVVPMLEQPAAALHADAEVSNELRTVLDEMKQQLRALSRHIALSASRWQTPIDAFHPLLSLLEERPAVAATASPADTAAPQATVESSAAPVRRDADT